MLLAAEEHERRRRVVVIIDEAHLLAPDQLEESLRRGLVQAEKWCGCLNWAQRSAALTMRATDGNMIQVVAGEKALTVRIAPEVYQRLNKPAGGLSQAREAQCQCPG